MIHTLTAADIDESERAIVRGIGPLGPKTLAVFAAARSTLPKTKLVDVWRVEYAKIERGRGGLGASKYDPCAITFTQHYEAQNRAASMRGSTDLFTCVHVTGPHKQEVPA